MYFGGLFVYLLGYLVFVFDFKGVFKLFILVKIDERILVIFKFICF